MKRLISILPILLLLIAPLAAYATYSDNFDSYAPATQNPGPWHYTVDTSVCWPQVGSDNAVFGYNGTAQTPPNVFNFYLDPTCASGTHTAGLWMEVNASSPEVNFSVYWKAMNANIVNASGVIFVFAAGSATSYALSSVSFSTWTKVFASGVATPGHIVKVGVNVTSYGSGSWFALGVDSTQLDGANPYTAGSNFFLINYATQQWFPIGSYPGSTLRVNYDSIVYCPGYGMVQASSTVCLYNGPLSSPDITLYLTGAILVTVTINGSVPYTRTLIPQPNLLDSTTPANQYMYLDIPQACPSICSYTLTINDFTGEYPSGTTEAYISQGSFVITSAQTSPIIAMTMQPGIYKLTLVSSNSLYTYTQQLSLSATDSSPSVLIQNGTIPITIGPFQQFSQSASWDCDTGGISATVTDSLGTMSAETFQLYRYNMTNPGGVIVWTFTDFVSGAPGFSVTYDFRNSTAGTNNINFTTPGEYKVSYQLNTTGIVTYGPYPVTASPLCVIQPNYSGLSGSFNISPAVMGLDQIFYTSNAYEEIFALIVMVMSVGIIGARMAHMSMLILGGELGMFSLMQWLPLVAAPLSSIFLFIGVIGFLANRSRRPIA